MKFAIAICFLIFCSSAAMADYYVATDGSDRAGNGSIGTPWATLDKARLAVRDDLAGNRNQNITVYLRGGTYYLSETVVFGQKDSPGDGYEVIYRSYPGETAVISSGTSIGGWSQVAVEDEPANLPAVASGHLWTTTTDKDFRTLYDGDTELPRARGDGWKSVAGSNNTLLYYSGTQIKNWSNLQDVHVYVRPYRQWVSNILPLASVDEVNKVATTAIAATYVMDPVQSGGDNVWVENVIEGLDRPGEWTLNTDTDTIYLWPPDDSPSSGIVAPTLVELIRVEGDYDNDSNDINDSSAAAKNITIKGLTFTHGDLYIWGPNEACVQHDWECYDTSNALVRLRITENCKVEFCTFKNAGGGGIRLDLRSVNNVVRGCIFKELGGSGIALLGYGPGTMNVSSHNLIQANKIRDCAEKYWSTTGIAVFQSKDNRIEHNLIYNLPYNGMFVSCAREWHFSESWANRREGVSTIRWGDFGGKPSNSYTEAQIQPWIHARNNRIEYNDIHHVMKFLGDGNGIYCRYCPTANGNKFRYNYIHDITGEGTASGFRCDGGQAGQTVYGNILYKVRQSGIKIKMENYVENNIIVDVLAPNEGYIALKPATEGAMDGAIVKRNICYHSANTPMDFYYDPSNQAGLTDSDYNLFHNVERPSDANSYLLNLQTKGIDNHSITFDPRFVDIAKGDFNLKPTSPAYSLLDFNELDFDAMGLREWQASEPSPEDGAMYVSPSVTLSWTAGRDANDHDVYFGTSYAVVANATMASDEFKGSQLETTYVPRPLDLDRTYYWRVDEVNGTDYWKGDVWSFTCGRPIPHLVGWWKFDENNGSTAIDSSGNGHHGIITGAAWVSGKIGNALDFEGTDYVTLDADCLSTLDKGVTIALWQYGDAAIQPRNDSIFYAENSSHERVLSSHLPYGNGTVYWDAGTTGGTNYDRIYKAASASEYEGQWNHWAFTKDVSRGEMRMYLNGALWHSDTGKTKSMSDITFFTISKTNSPYDGMIDDVRVYNSALSASEIADIYNYLPSSR